MRHDWIDPTKQMARRNAFFEVEQVEKLALIARLPAHHGPPPSPQESDETESQCADGRDTFFNSIDPKRTLGGVTIHRLLLGSTRPAKRLMR